MISTRRYCSLADNNYLPQLVALYKSLYRHSSRPFDLDVLAMDEECEAALRSLDLVGVNVFRLSVVEDFLKLKPVRDSRTWQEYCWTMASQFAWFVRREGRDVTYLDADTFFFSDPEAVFAEIGDKSIGIIPHRFAERDRPRLEPNGKFNVSWVTFRGPVGFRCLETWARQCREKCSAKEGCGDQCYLDSWSSNYPGEVCEIENIGVGAAPWNLSQYKVTGDAEGVRIDGQPLVLFHYHEFVPGKRLTNYKLSLEARALIYSPYVDAVIEAHKQVDSLMMAVK